MGKYTSKQLIGFILPSVVGILLFMIPIQVDDSWTIVVKLIADIIGDAFAGFLPILCVSSRAIPSSTRRSPLRPSGRLSV